MSLESLKAILKWMHHIANSNASYFSISLYAFNNECAKVAGMYDECEKNFLYSI